jgi:hypothetical protein
MAQISRRMAAVVACLAVAVLPARAETPSQRYVEVRTALGFRVTEAAVSALLPKGWKPAPSVAGPSAGVNLSVNLTERVVYTTAEGKPIATGRAWDLIFVVPGREETGQAAGAVVVLVLTRPEFTPGSYQTAVAAEITAERALRAAPDGTTLLSENWSATLADGSNLTVRLRGLRGTPVRQLATTRTYSGAVAGMHRIYETDQGIDVMRGIGVADRVQEIAVQASGPRFAPLFDGKQQLISVTAIPWLMRTASIP